MKIILILFLIIGLHIVYTLDEVDFVQNLVFYIEQSYMIPVSLKKRKQRE
jgi:phosphorylase kinase alpha/beta subunit